jgi:hypothetical protein
MRKKDFKTSSVKTREERAFLFSGYGAFAHCLLNLELTISILLFIELKSE